MHLLTPQPWPLTFQHQNNIVLRISQGHSLYQGWTINTLRPFVFNMHQSYCALYSYRLDVCLSVTVCQSVCPSVTCWYCVETAQPIVKLSSLPGNSTILVFWGPNFFPEFQWEHPNGALNARGRKKVAISDQYLAIARKRLKIDGYMLQCVWQALNPLFIHVTFSAIVPGEYPWEAKMCRNWRTN